jgi:hypothetical protein
MDSVGIPAMLVVVVDERNVEPLTGERQVLVGPSPRSLLVSGAARAAGGGAR